MTEIAVWLENMTTVNRIMLIYGALMSGLSGVFAIYWPGNPIYYVRSVCLLSFIFSLLIIFVG